VREEHLEQLYLYIEIVPYRCAYVVYRRRGEEGKMRIEGRRRNSLSALKSII
jgi:hypothetical protein